MQSRRFRYTMFAMLYFVQGSALAYLRNFLKPFLDDMGIDPDVIGLFAGLLLLPFILKIFIGMLSDRYNLLGKGHRRPYIIIGLLGGAIAFVFATIILPLNNFFLFAILILFGATFVALFDSTADGLAIDSTPAHEQGTVQGVMVGGRAAGFIILSLVFGALVQSRGHGAVFLVIAASMLLPIIWVVRVKEPAKRQATQQFDKQAFRALLTPRFLYFSAFAIVYAISAYGIDGIVTLFMSQTFNATESVIGQYGAIRGIGAVMGAILGGVLLDRIGRFTGSYTALLLVTLAGFGLALSTSIGMTLTVGLFWGMAWAFIETIFVALAMALADSRIAASMFALMMAISNVGVAIGEGFGTSLTDNIGFTAVFAIFAAINLINFPILRHLFKIAPEIGKQPVEGITTILKESGKDQHR
ncbi:MAG: MFS transporter [Chloroflexi bacterium]|nr:MFS transporter [Chloroflexota bacterium]